MKKGLKLLAVLLSMFVCVKGVYADEACDATVKQDFGISVTEYEYVDQSWVINKLYSYTTDGLVVDNDAISYDASTNTLTLNNVNSTTARLTISNSENPITIVLNGDNVVNYVYIANADVTFTGNGNLTTDTFYGGDDDCYASEVSSVTFDMSGTVTINDYIIVKGTLTLADGISLEDGYDIYTFTDTYDYNYISTAEVEESSLYNNYGYYTGAHGLIEQLYSSNVVIKGTEKTNTLTNIDSDTTFTSSTALSTTYSLKTEELLSSLSTDALNTILSVKDNSSLLVLYDVKVVDASGATVTMENGNYVIRFYLSSAEQAKYSSLVGIYVNDEGAVAETFDVTVNGDYVEFTTTHLSNYGILGISNVTTISNTTTTDVTVENPSTYDNIYNIITLVVVGLAGAGVMAYKLKRR